MTIRLATKEDKELVRELWVEFGAELGGPEYLRESWEDAWSDLSQTVRTGVALIAEEGGTAVGFVFCVLGSPGRKTAHVTDIYVRPDARNKGIGRALLAGILEPARSAGLDHASLEVLIRNSDARRLYERLGFTPMDVFMVAPLGALADQLASDERPASAGSLHVQTDDEAGDRDRSAQRRLGAELSERMGVPTVALALEEESVVRYLLFERGRMVDEYLSVPTYYGELNTADELSLSSNPMLAARVTGADPERVRAVARIASSPSELPPARELLGQVADVLGLEARIDR